MRGSDQRAMLRDGSQALARLARAAGAVLRRGEFGTVAYEISLDALPTLG